MCFRHARENLEQKKKKKINWGGVPRERKVWSREEELERRQWGEFDPHTSHVYPNTHFF